MSHLFYSETYLFALRTASGLLDATTGLLITGCPNPTVIAGMYK